jgi:hypothetical protein
MWFEHGITPGLLLNLQTGTYTDSGAADAADLNSPKTVESVNSSKTIESVLLPSAVQCCTGARPYGSSTAQEPRPGHCQEAAQFAASVLAMPLTLFSEMRLEESTFTITGYPSSGAQLAGTKTQRSP